MISYILSIVATIGFVVALVILSVRATKTSRRFKKVLEKQKLSTATVSGAFERKFGYAPGAQAKK